MTKCSYRAGIFASSSKDYLHPEVLDVGLAAFQPEHRVLIALGKRNVGSGCVGVDKVGFFELSRGVSDLSQA